VPDSPATAIIAFPIRMDKDFSMASRAAFPLAVSALVGFVLVSAQPRPAAAAAIAVQSYASMSEFFASPLYAYMAALPGGPSVHGAVGIFSVQQGTSNVPVNSAGAAGNGVVSQELLDAVTGAPDVLNGGSSSSAYMKKFVSLGQETSGGPPPLLALQIPSTSSAPAGGYLGYDIAIVDLGKNLAGDSGSPGGEATIFQVQLLTAGTVFEVGSINSSGGNFINVILLDISGIPDIPAMVDGVRIVDITDSGGSSKGALDVDGALRLNLDQPVQTTASTWGRIKALTR